MLTYHAVYYVLYCFIAMVKLVVIVLLIETLFVEFVLEILAINFKTVFSFLNEMLKIILI